MKNTYPLRIACLSYQGLSSYGLEPTLAHMFPYAEIVSIYPQHLRAHTLKSYDLLVMPGIVGEDSPYPEIFPMHKAEQIVQAMDEDGLILWTSCAATYYFFEKMIYLKRDGKIKSLNGLGIIQGYAEGPAYRHITRDEFSRSAHKDRVLAEISLAHSSKIFRALDINGPALYPSETSLVDSFLRYTDVPQKPVAGFTKKIGKGLIVGLSSHPEFTLKHPMLPEYFREFEPNRLEFLRNIREKVLKHWQFIGKIPDISTTHSMVNSHG